MSAEKRSLVETAEILSFDLKHFGYIDVIVTLCTSVEPMNSLGSKEAVFADKRTAAQSNIAVRIEAASTTV